MQLLESIDRLLLEGRLRDITFDDLFGPKGRRTVEFNQLDHWLGEEWERIVWDLKNDLWIKRFKPEEIRSTSDFKRWASQERFGKEYGFPEDLPEEYNWEELYHLWMTSGWGGFHYDGHKWRSAVDDFAEKYEYEDVQDDLWDSETFKEVYRGWARDRFYEIVNTLEMRAIAPDGRVHIWREMSVREDWLDHLAKKGKRLGEFWSWLEGAAEAHWDGGKARMARIKSSVDEKYVNWRSTIMLNMDPSLGDMEKEIRLFKNTRLRIERLWLDGKEVDLPDEIKTKTFKA